MSKNERAILEINECEFYLWSERRKLKENESARIGNIANILKVTLQNNFNVINIFISMIDDLGQKFASC